MMKLKKVQLLLLLVLAFSLFAGAEEEKLVTLTVRNAEIKDVLIMLTEQSGINLVPDETVQGMVTINLVEVTFIEALKVLTLTYNYHFEKITENAYRVSRNEFSDPPYIEVKDNRLTLKVDKGDLRKVLEQISRQAGFNIIMDQSVSGNLSVELKDAPIEKGLESLLTLNGFTLQKKDDIYFVTRTERIPSMHGPDGQNLEILYSDGKVTINVQQADLNEVLRTLACRSGINMIIYSSNRVNVDAQLKQLPLEETIKIMLAGTSLGYRKIDDIYLIGEKKVDSPVYGLFATEALIPIEYLQVEKVPPLLPNTIEAANIKVIKEQNALLVQGTQDEINSIKEYISKIDLKIPQIVVEALIIELSQTENRSSGVKTELVEKGEEDEHAIFDSALGQLTYKSVIKLPLDFYVRLENLVKQGEARIKARPNITTLNGQQAKINVGTVQYYKVIETDENNKEVTKYQSINAGVTLDVTPWVSHAGEITVKLLPTVSNLGGATTEGPPQISQRMVETTVRVKNGQTIVIGGLIQDVDSNNISKIPILGDLPLIGRLFQWKTNNVNQAELLIYITPHILREEEIKSSVDLGL